MRVELFGNSIAREVRDCLGAILRARSASLESISSSSFFLCRDIARVDSQVRNPRTHPDAAVLYALSAPDPACAAKTLNTPIDRLVALWKAAGVHVYLVPPVPPILGSPSARPRSYPTSQAVSQETAYYLRLARQDPIDVTVVDASAFMHTDDGQYPWRMPCLRGEPGCDRHGTVGIRWTDGFHYCTSAVLLFNCPSANGAGVRRVAAAIAAGLLPRLQTNNERPNPP